MGWARAEEACNEVWDHFSDEFNRLIDIRIEQAESRIDPSHIGSIPTPTEATAAQLRECKQKFADLFPHYRKAALANVKKKLCGKGKLGKVDGICSRHPVKGRHRKPGRPRSKSKKRRHVATGRPRGWNASASVPYPHRAGRRKKKL